jgi:hypothetical protein
MVLNLKLVQFDAPCANFGFILYSHIINVQSYSVIPHPQKIPTRTWNTVQPLLILIRRDPQDAKWL